MLEVFGNWMHSGKKEALEWFASLKFFPDYERIWIGDRMLPALGNSTSIRSSSFRNLDPDGIGKSYRSVVVEVHGRPIS
jgi:hypothetical protein